MAAPFIGFAVVLDMLDGRIARMTNTTSAFGLEFDSLADVISFGVAPAVLAFAWGLSDLGRVGWAAGFVYVTAAAMRLARFNIQSAAQVDKRYFVGMPSPAAAGIVAATVYAWPYPLGRVSAGDRGGGRRARAGRADGQHDPVPQLQDDQLRLEPVVHADLSWSPALIALIATEPRIDAGASSPTAICCRRSSRWRSRGCGRTATDPPPPRGSVIVTVVPAPGALASAIVPPSRSMFRCALASPRPDPAVLVEKYGSNARRRASSSMPTPVSAIDQHDVPPGRHAPVDASACRPSASPESRSRRDS